jgi:hypothetical protein
LKADGSQIPAVLFAGSDGGGCGHEVVNRLVQAGFALRADHASLSEHPLAWSQVKGQLISSLPVAVSGLNDRWSAFLYDRQLKKSRPVGVLEGKAWAVINLAGQADLFVGHPVLVDHAELFVQLTQSGVEKWTLEIHNPTDAPIPTRLRVHPCFDPLRGKALPAGPIAIPSGESWIGNY